MADILIVDDDPLVREYLSAAVNMEGHRCATAEHGGQAIELLSHARYDLAFIDMFMPVQEGIETIIAMRRQFPSTRIIAMSAGAKSLPGGQVLDYALQFGADEVLPKPFSLDTFRTVFRHVLAMSSEVPSEKVQ